MRPVGILVIGRPKDVADKQPIGRGNDGTERGEERSDGGRRRPRWEHGGRLPQKRRLFLRRDHGTPARSRGGARAHGGCPARRSPTTATGRSSRTRRAGRLLPLTNFGVVLQPQARRQRRARRDGRTGPSRPRRRRRGARRHSSRRGGSRRRALRGRGGRGSDEVGGRSRRGRGARSPDGAVGGSRRGRLHISRRGCSTTGPRRRRRCRRWGTGGATAGGRWRRRRRQARTELWRGHGDGGPACTRLHAAEETRPTAARAGRAPLGARGAAAKCRGRRQPTARHAAVAARSAWSGHSPSSAMIASGDSICMKGIICIGW